MLYVSEIVLTGEPGERGKFVQWLEEVCRDGNVPPPAANAVDLALEEHLTNVLSYGYEAGNPHRVVVAMKVNGSCVNVEVEDDGRPFDPLTAPPVDTTTALDDKPIGGLGVHLMRQFMDDLSYIRKDGKNMLRMKKNFASANKDRLA